MSSIKPGPLGESIACRWLTQHGYTIVDRNVRCGHSELDIIARKGSTTYYVEVKTAQVTINTNNRIVGSYFDPVENLTRHKLHKFERACHSHSQTNHIKQWRPLALAVLVDTTSDKAKVSVIELD